MNEEYRGFKLYGGCEPVSETLLGRVTQWEAHKPCTPTRTAGLVHCAGLRGFGSFLTSESAS